MATQVITKSQMQLLLDGGLGENGETIVKKKSFNNVKTDATPDQIYAVGQALASLQAYPLMNIVRNDSYDVNEL